MTMRQAIIMVIMMMTVTSHGKMFLIETADTIRTPNEHGYSITRLASLVKYHKSVKVLKVWKSTMSLVKYYEPGKVL